MGHMITLEAPAAQIYARYGDAAADKIGAVVFASPISTSTSSVPRSSGSARGAQDSPS
jgi:hypothetical protein